MFGRSHAEAVVSATCPKCGFAEVVGDSCPRCRVKVSNYRVYLASLDDRARRRRRWFPRLRLVRTMSRPLPSTDRRTIYEELILGRIYRELRYPATARGVYLVLLAFDVTAAGRVAGLRVTVNPSNPDVGASIRTALNRAQPFPAPTPDGRNDSTQHVSLALTVNI